MKKLMVMFLVALFSVAMNVAIAQEEAAPAEEATKALFVGSKANLVYHKAECPAVAELADEDKQEFATEEEAVAAGMTVADCCKSTEETGTEEVAAEEPAAAEAEE